MSDVNTPRETLIEFPCEFPLKIMGTTHEAFAITMLQVVQQYAPDTQEHHVRTRLSSKGNFTSATITVTATDQEQLDNIYRSLTSHPMVKVVY
ncbi:MULTISPECIES: HP0495 family protein [Vitreoscilla]|uniref:UPF0250 protein LVJ81_03485 n=1 Tax=Vitreoscilla stercoraria TaxID=61 RepID=A0ABY4EDT9_VITST|nr:MULTISPECIES: DUF493 domain-containing protein [Vitreoscilla]AUZ04006.1 hypothetical protein ADP71_01770 [Vitreoscilla sp. C1]UOO93105.1 DUF493 family protein [Vitreoscilla stercoraria]